jgi:hypothetical protein
VRASAATPAHATGEGIGSVAVSIVNSSAVRSGHLFKVGFMGSPDSVHADSYTLVDSTTHELLFKTGRDFSGAGVGPVGAGLLPIVKTPATVAVDTAHTGFDAGHPTNVRLLVDYQPVVSINLRRIGFPDDITVTFDNVVRDTSLAIFPIPARPAKFIAVAHTASGDIRLDFRFRDIDLDGTLSRTDEFIDLVTYEPANPTTPRVTWRLQIDPASVPAGGTIVPPTLGDVFQLRVTQPFGIEDTFVFETQGEHVDAARARTEFTEAPYVVPNPYVGSASFEPERFNVSGRGERRMEFRNVPRNCSIRIFSVRGDLVQTLRHDGSLDGYVAWNMRTKDNLDVAPGLYVFQVDGGELGSQTGKFAIIK